MHWHRRWPLLALPLFVSLLGAAPSRELTPEQRARVFSGKPRAVRIAREAGSAGDLLGRIPLAGTDHRGFYRCPYMQVTVNGRGPFTFLLDTGSSYNSISSRVVEAAHVTVEVDRGGYHDLLHIDRLEAGSVEVEGLVAVRDDDFGVDGVLGIRAFGDMALTFELADRELLVSPDPLPLAGSFRVFYQLDHGLPTVPVMVGSRRVSMLLDTGDDAYAFEVRSADLGGASLAHPPLPAEPVLNGANTQVTAVSTLTSTVRLGPLSFRDAVVGINDSLPVPDFGVDFLAQFDFAIDPRRMTVTFAPRSDVEQLRITGNPTPGFSLSFDAAGTVSRIIPGSLAEQRGMTRGDHIIAIGDRPIGELDPRRWDAALAAGEPLEVRWVHDSEERTDSFPVSVLR